ncbi:MAG: class I SAM-dependent methyltransferase [Anaerolineales bacterium]
MDADQAAAPDWLRHWIDHVPRGNALDLGAGSGELSVWLSQRGFQVTAVERDPEALTALRHRAENFRFQVVEADLASFQPKPQSQSLILAAAVLHFLMPGRLKKVAERMEHALIPGGFLMAEVLTIDDPSFRERVEKQEPIEPNTYPIEGGEGFIHYFEKGELKRVFPELQILRYEEDRRAAPAAIGGYRAGATLVARRPHP